MKVSLNIYGFYVFTIFLTKRQDFMLNFCVFIGFYPTALKGCQGIVFTHGVWMGGCSDGRAVGNSLSGLYLRNRKV